MDINVLDVDLDIFQASINRARVCYIPALAKL